MSTPALPRENNGSWLQLMRQRVRTLPFLKGTGNTLFLVLFFYLYLYIQRNPVFEVFQIPATELDRWIGFQPWALGLYLSLWVYTALPVALQPDLRRLTRYGLHIGLMCAASLLIFVFWPTSVSAAVGPREGGGIFAMMYAVDTNGNACPSLHVAAAVFSFMWLQTILKSVRAPAWVRWVDALWCIGICYSTLAVKQHLLIDLIAGAALGAAAGWLSLRSASRGNNIQQI
ncbi:phosphatase PAP2 family protein [Ottowia thiooxydans]|uniref:phosphatase PAP2 family protein n=1 Tax=Ottowia thiooxydans TaxID=219182 RepID=UPI00040B1FB4|nr:phosphatase PAP2 family protein [Ottowia thiooxydans]